MRTELCHFSGFKIYPGHGKKFCRIDGKVFNLYNTKCESLFKSKKNPRKIRWTILYRRKFKKGMQADESKARRTRRTVKFQRPVQGTSWGEIMAKRNQKPEVRKAIREQAIKIAKEKKRTADQAKKAQKTKDQPKPSGPRMKATKHVRQAAPRVGGKR